ncbi:FAD/NAD(P)-binding protein, partial [Pedobacter terrae]|uniref:FAD/NAD(P)-binding protein n=1 Tax=Pedobacter terrae TaxID=405671 RepID=UPI002FFB3034
MDTKTAKKKIAIIGGGPSGLFMYKRLIESKDPNFEIEIFERKDYLGAGMPYSAEGANVEHITNVSDNEIPIIFNSIEDWVKIAPQEILKKFDIDSDKFNEYKVLPRLFFGEYLSAQFNLLEEVAENKG